MALLAHKSNECTTKGRFPSFKDLDNRPGILWPSQDSLILHIHNAMIIFCFQNKAY